MTPKPIQRSPFPPPPATEWQAQVERDLKGANFEKRLVRNTPEGVRIQPLYTADDRPSTPDYSGLPGGQSRTRGERLRPAGEQWRICSVIREPDPTKAAALAARELNDGATGLVFAQSSPWQQGALWTELFAALEGREVHISLPSTAAKPLALRAIAEHGRQAAHPHEALRIHAGLDIVGDYAAHGVLNEAAWTEAVASLQDPNRPAGRLLRADDKPYHGAGASEAESLGFLLAGAIDTFRALESRGISVDEASANLQFLLHLDTEFFMGIAKIRAARRLWNHIRNECGFTADMVVQVRTSPRVMTSRDPWINMLRNTTTCFAGAVAGADAIATDSFDALLGVPSETGQRLARNTQLILGLESHLGKVLDPAGGSYFIEQLTEDLATRAWGVLQQVEERGGMVKALASGWVSETVQSTRAARDKTIRRRKRAITGVSAFPNLSESAPAQSPYPTAPVENAQTDNGLAQLRFAAPFEDFRSRSDRWLASTGERPKIGLLNLGPVANHTGRSMFIRNLVQVGGFEPVMSEPILSVDDALQQGAQVKGLPLILCASNADAKTLARPIASALTSKGVSVIWMAGQPEADMSSYADAGIGAWVKLGDDMVERLGDLWAVKESK
jgi:methylmalonyl-CoA mutase